MKWPRLLGPRPASVPALPPARFVVDRERLFDLDKTRALVELLGVPRVRLMVDPNLRPTRNLVVGRKRGELPADASWDVHCNRLLWYLPRGRSSVLMPDDWRLADMTPLEQLAGQAPGPAAPSVG